MKNKKTLKNILEEKINQETIYKKIIKKEDNKRKQIVIGLFLPTCFLLLISMVLLLNETEKKYDRTNSTNKIEIEREENNNTNSSSTEKNDSSYSASNSIEDTEYKVENYEQEIILPFKNIVLPSDLKNTENQNIYEKEKIIGYQKTYRGFENRYFTISLFQRKTQLEEDKTSSINNRKFQIDRYSNFYIVQFHYEEYHIEIRTTIKEEELLTFLESL